jgi:Kelch motif
MGWKLLFAGAAAVLPLLACGSTPKSASATLAELPPLSAPRATHAIVRSGDALLLIGGCVRDGCDPGPQSATVDIVVPGRAPAIGRLLARRVQPSAAALPGGKLLVIGGWVDGRVAASTEIFDVRARASTRGPRLTTPRSSAGVVALRDGRILIAGGYDGENALASAEVYDPRTGVLVPTGNLREARSGATATLLPDGRVLIADGGTGEGEGRAALASTEIYDPATGRFSAAASLRQRRYKHGAVALPGGDILVLGGSDERDYGGKLDLVERFDHRSGRWAPAGRLAQPRFKLADASVLLDSGRVLVAGGFERPELFDPASGTSRLLDESLGGRWNYLTAARVPGGVFLAGGYSEGTIRISDRAWLLRL